MFARAAFLVTASAVETFKLHVFFPTSVIIGRKGLLVRRVRSCFRLHCIGLSFRLFYAVIFSVIEQVTSAIIVSGPTEVFLLKPCSLLSLKANRIVRKKEK